MRSRDTKQTVKDTPPPTHTHMSIQPQALGIAFGVVSTFLRIRNNKEEQVYDRCYRLRYNSGQVRTDKFTYGGLVLGGVGGVAAKLAAGPLVSGVQGASLGAGLAVFAHVLTKPKAKN